MMEQLNNITLHFGDCMDMLKNMPDKSFDLAIVDPPYFSGPERRQFYGCKVSKIGVKRLYEKSETWEVPTAEYFDELQRVSKYYIVWGCNYFNYIFAPGRIVWDKCNGSSSFSDCEIAATNLFTSVRLFPFMWNGMMQGKSVNEGRIMQGNKKLNEKRIHPTQKPVALYTWLLTKFAKEKWRILDTHLGSGSIAIACENFGCSLLGIEKDEHYYHAARERIIHYQHQQHAPIPNAGLTCSTSYVGEVFTATPRSGAYTSPTMRIQSTTHKYRGCAGSFTSTFNSSSHDGLNVPLNLKPSFINNPISLHYD